MIIGKGNIHFQFVTVCPEKQSGMRTTVIFTDKENQGKDPQDTDCKGTFKGSVLKKSKFLWEFGL